MPELVPREDLVQAIALNGIGFNLTRAVGPALAGFLILLGGSSLAFSLYAHVHRRGDRRAVHLAPRPPVHRPAARASAVRDARRRAVRAQYAGDPGAMVRTIAFSVPAAAPWALLPLLVREELGLGPGMYGVILGMMGIGGVTSGMLLPLVRGRLSRGATVVALHAVLLRRHRAARRCRTTGCPPRSGMLLFGVGWTSAYATIQAAAQLVCPPWVRARSLAIYQLAQNGALTARLVRLGLAGRRDRPAADTCWSPPPSASC